MGLRWNFVAFLSLLFLLASTTKGQSVFDVTRYGAKPNTDITHTLKFNFVTNSIVKDITSLDSKNFHINLLGCKNITFEHVTISAPENSPNTDGIHISSSEQIRILNTKISTGDDCVSVGDSNKDITIRDVTCGPGHGISIGSLGKYTKEKAVEGVWVTKCKLIKTTNGVRIKTWPDSAVKYSASDMHFEDIEMIDVSNPILIDQEYCPWNQCNRKPIISGKQNPRICAEAAPVDAPSID
uniref:Polygalacturonase n=1 Tax=Cucumis sativus TaxID=3659 RepID=A0A0A0KPH7_CUCSA